MGAMLWLDVKVGPAAAGQIRTWIQFDTGDNGATPEEADPPERRLENAPLHTVRTSSICSAHTHLRC